MPKSLVNRIRLVFLPFDVIFGVLIPLAVMNGIDPADTTRTLLVLYGLGIARIAINMLMIGRIFARAAHWLAIAPSRPETRELREADEGLRAGAGRFTAVVMVTWALHLGVSTLVLLFVDRYTAGV